MQKKTKYRKRKMERILYQAMAAFFISCAGSGYAWAAAEDRPADAYTLDDVVVTASRIPTTRMDTPANTTVITAAEIENNHYADVAEALSHVNGVIISNGASGNDTVVRLNGDERVVILVDGRRINNDQGSMTRASANLESIASMKNIERIEVIKGGGSALYGSDAIGGVINIITKKGDQLRTTLDVNAGSWGTYNYELSNEGSMGRVSWFVTGGMQRQNHFDYKYDGGSHSMPNSNQKNNSFTARIDGEIDDRSSLRLEFEHKSIHGGAYTGVFPNFRFNGKQDELFNNVALSYHFKEGTKTPGFLRVYDNYKWTSFGLDGDGADQSSPFTTNTLGIEYQNGWALSKTNTLVAGAEWRESDSKNSDYGYSGERIRNGAIYLQDTWAFAPKWTLVPGLRMDHHSLSGTHWSPKLALNYNAGNKTQFYASWGRVFKAPTADDLYYNDPRWLMFGNPDLKPETGHTETIGVTHKIDDKTTVAASLFWSEIHDAIYWVYDDTTWRTDAMNVAYEKKHGFELSVQKIFDKHWSVDAGYSYIKTNALGSTSSTDVTGKNQQPNGYRLGIHFKKGPWKANLMGTFGSGLDRQFYTTGSYTLIDFNASYDITKDLTAYFKANNLTNQEYQISPATNWAQYPGKGRFFQFGLTCSF